MAHDTTAHVSGTLSARMRAWHAFAVSAMAAAALATGACSLFVSYDGFHEDKACGKRVPARPSGGPVTAGGELVGAMSELRFLAAAGGAPLGYDLDGLCTCPEKRACTNVAATDQQCDVPSTGIDNAGGKILGLLFPPDADGRVQSALDTGQFGLVLRVQDWDGKPDDADVKVSAYNVAGIQDGAFLVDDASLLTSQDLGARVFDTSAYVAGGLLVATFDLDLRLVVPTGAEAAQPTTIVTIPLSASKLVGRIAKVGDKGLVLTGAQLVGRITAPRIFEQLGALGICQGSAAFPGLKQQTCAALDVPALPTLDGKGAACDALSFAVGATFVPVTIGGHAPAAPPIKACAGEAPVTCP
ncbi:MAG: hypothetical protein JWP97_1514 [Labilithrix sp.]|nr:hypothetical protein [Labilithrix sp.]